MLVRDFEFALPEELIAQQPPAAREGARMLTVDRRSGALGDKQFVDLPELLREGDVLVVNDSRVLPARLYAQREGDASRQTGQQPARIEVLLTEQQSEWEWKALVRPGRKVQAGTRLSFLKGAVAKLRAEIIARGDFGERTLRFDPVPEFYAALESLGHMPLPPYIRRGDAIEDRERYQTVYAREPGSVAAPTAGLHFTEPVLAAIRARGVTIVPVTLHVGLGTFQPVRVETLDEIRLHTERYTLPAATAAAINGARRHGRRIVAAGTTTVRTLEHCAREASGGGSAADWELVPHSGATSIFLSPGSKFAVVDALLTNFHLPQSTLLMLVCAFAGYERTMAAYRRAVAQRYRFFSYGDCMLVS